MTMTSITGFDLGSLLAHGLRDLDISEAERDLAIGRYTDLGDEFDDHWSDTRGDNVVSPQGSFLLGTVVRNINRNEGIDIDLVAMRDIDKTSTTQAELKGDAGVVVGNYQRAPHSATPKRSECSRCWTLTWPGMHLDVLPAVPNREPHSAGILITDKDVVRWLPSDPDGYAAWFRGQMSEQVIEERAILARKMQIANVPDWQVKTTLQRAIQALKRHRDIYFAGRDDKPASIVITTLAARAYQGGSDAYDVLRSVTTRMDDFLVQVDGKWTLPNPVQPGEDFADSWAASPGRAKAFFEWLENAQQTFDGFGRKAGLDNSVPLLGEAFGDRFAKSASRGLGSAVYNASQSGALRSANGSLLIGAGAAYDAARRTGGNRFAGGSTD